jgi:hypothetical protein
VGRREALEIKETHWRAVLAQALEEGVVESALLERESRRDRRFRFLREQEIKPFLPSAL